MASNVSIVIIDAPAEKVWQAITAPELVKQWQYGSDLITTWELETEIKFRTEWEGKVFEQWGKVLEITPYERISYSLFAPRPGLEDKPENYFTMNYTLTPEHKGTKLEIVQEDNRPGAAQAAQQGEENPVLQALKKIAESL